MGHMAHLSDHFQLYGNISLFSIPIELVTNTENLFLLIHCFEGLKSTSNNLYHHIMNTFYVSISSTAEIKV